jgi:tetratricopeptide (TPR) repeat protein
MTFAVLLGALCTIIAAGLGAPFLTTRRADASPPAGRAESSRSLLRQLRDLDDDLAAGRVLEADHLRLRSDLERQAADALRREESLAGGSRGAVAVRDGRGGRRPAPAGSRLTRLGVGIGIVALVAAGLATLLLGAVDPRAPQAAASGTDPTAASPGPDGSAPGAGGAGDPLSPDALAEVETALTVVKRHPGRAAAHVELARAYAAVRQPQLAAVEYLAATRLDPANPEANTALAMVAYRSGSARQADALVSRALDEHPGYPEALYTRGLIRAMGLHQTAAAARDLRAYRRAAPHGAHRTTVSTVLALLEAEAIK